MPTSRLRRSLVTALPALGLITTAGAAIAISSSLASATASARPASARPASARPASATTAPPAPLTSLSCTSATFCMAVGASSATQATQLAAEDWDGARWTRLPISQPSGITYVGPQAVDCPSSTQCVAVGSGTKGKAYILLAETWTPATGWTTSQPVQPGGTGYDALSSVSCPTVRLCFAAGGTGEFAKPAAQQLPLVERWTAGTWTRMTLSQPAGASEPFLNGISCASAGQCAAVGGYTTGSTGQGLIEQLSGATWTGRAAPGSTGGGLNDVSCPDTTACEAVGQSGSALLAERWTGGSWVPTTPAQPANTSTPALTGVSCASATHCVAIGFGFLPGSKSVAFVDTLGPAWTVTAQTGTGFGIADLNAVKCFSTATKAPSCALLGGSTSVIATMRPLSAFLTGTAWSIVPTV